MLLALVVGSPVHAKAKKKPAKISKIMVNPSGIVTYATDERYESEKTSAFTSMYLAEPTEDATSFAGEVGAYIMSERVINFMEAKYNASESYIQGYQVRNFVYFYGFDVTSQDVRGSAFYGIDQRQELVMRENMTSSFKGYMLGKGLMEYLKTLKATRGYVATAERVQQASQLSVEFKSTNSETGEEVPAWKIKSGPDLGSRTIFAKAEKGDWNFEVRNSFGFNDFTAHAGHQFYRSGYSVKYFNNSKVFTPGYQYQIAKMWWARWSADLPATGEDKYERVFQSVGLRHLF